MRWAHQSADWLRRQSRGLKFSILLVAAWAPFAFPTHLLASGLLMGLASGLFWAATQTSTPQNDDEPGHEP